MKRRIAVGLFLAATACVPGATLAWASFAYYLAPDVPANLAGVDYLPWEIVLSSNGAYASMLLLGDDMSVGALHRLPSGDWLLVPAMPVVGWGGTTVQTRDVVRFNGVTPTLYFAGGAAGVPEGVRIDAVMLDTSGTLILSFDVPVNIGGVEYGPGDLVRFTGGVFSLYWGAAAAGVPPDVNLVGVGLDVASQLVVSFDVPVNLGGTEYLPGTLVAWTGAGFLPYAVDPAWPPSVQLHDFAFRPPAGVVPDGGAAPGVPLMVSRTGTTLTLSWGSSCSLSDSDYEVYEGTIGSNYSHTRKSCTTGGATSISFAEPAINAYYLVVPKNAVSEGSYGRSSSGAERPQGLTVCLPQQAALTCP